MKVQVLMSTMKAQDIKSVMDNKNITGSCIIVNQLMPPKITKDNNWTMYSYNEKGLSNSRNRLLEHSNEDIGIISDDDVTFINDYQTILAKKYQETNADIITFNFKKGNQIYGKQKEFTHSRLSLLSVGSIQISFKVDSIKKNNITFNSNFGLGAKYKSGEENIFLNDCYNAKLKIVHIPIVLCEHIDEETTGEIWDKDLIIGKGALFYNLFGAKNFLSKFYLMITKYKLYKNIGGPFQFLKLYNQGVKEYKELIK